MANIDYLTIERDYMTSQDSLRTLAAKYGVSKSVLWRYAKEHEWDKKRDSWDKKRQKRANKAIEKEIDSQEEAWRKLKDTMREVLDNEWQKLKAEKHPSGSQVSALSKATRDARDMGVYGVSLSDKKLMKEIESLEKQLATNEETKDITITIEGGEGYDG